MKQITKCKNEAMEKVCIMLENPTTPKIKHNLYRIENNKIVESCAFGEIGLQLHLPTYMNIFDITIELVKIGIPKQFIDVYYGDANLYKSVVNWNDSTDLTKPEIAQEIREKFGDIE